jgi:hypothetical protein
MFSFDSRKSQRWSRIFFLLVRKSQIRKFFGSFHNPKSANSEVFQSANPQICKEKSSVSDPDPHWFASEIFLP